jgi:ABC-2 type transport system ATP-binding protein
MAPRSAGTMILAEGLHKRYSRVHALRGLDLSVPAGSVCGLLGPNGAGKTNLGK